MHFHLKNSFIEATATFCTILNSGNHTYPNTRIETLSVRFNCCQLFRQFCGNLLFSFHEIVLRCPTPSTSSSPLFFYPPSSVFFLQRPQWCGRFALFRRLRVGRRVGERHYCCSRRREGSLPPDPFPQPRRRFRELLYRKQD